MTFVSKFLNMLRKLHYLITTGLLLSTFGQAQSPNGVLNFGTTADNTTATIANTGFGGVRVGSAGGSFVIQNSGTEIGTDGELRGIAPTTTSVNSVGISSTEYGTAATTFTVSFEIRLSGGTSGIWYFFAGNGASFAASQTVGFTGNQVFTGLRWTFGASNGITTANRANTSWVDISGTPFAQNTSYHVSIVGNNSASSVNYGNGESVAANTYDLWVNGVRLGNDLAKGALTTATTINAFRFYGESSTSNVATINLDNIVWWNSCVAPSFSSYASLTEIPAGTYTDVFINQNTTMAGAVSVNRNVNLVANTLTTGGNLSLKSSSTGTAQVVGGTNASITGNVTVERFLPWTSANNNGFRFVGHPLRSNPVINTVTNLPTASNTVIGYNEAQNAYVGIDDRTATWPQGTSYGVWTNAANTLSFTGELQLSDVSPISLTRSSQRWHFLANPFPSVLDWNAVSRTDVLNAVYVWEKDNSAEGSGAWGSFIDGVSANNGGRYLAPGQGFMVRTADTGSPSITFPAAARSTASNPSYYRQQNVVGDVFRLRVAKPANQTGMETVIRFRNQATASFDADYDAEFITDWMPASPDLYTTDANGQKYSIQALPALGNQATLVPLGLETFGAGAYVLTFDASGMQSRADVRLEDRRDGSFTQVMPGQPITITTGAQDVTGRFVLHFNSLLTTSVNPSDELAISIYTHEGALYINGLERGDVRITDLSGRTVYQQAGQAFGEAIRLALARGAYLVQVNSAAGSKFVKVIF
jgi:hypothetical protein